MDVSLRDEIGRISVTIRTMKIFVPRLRILVPFLMCVVASLVVVGCRQQTSAPPPPLDRFQQPQTNPRANPQMNPNGGLPNGGLPNGDQGSGGFNMNAPILPNSQMTPGDTLDVTVADIAVPGYTKKVRNVPSSVKKQVYAEYGIASRLPKEYEVDHLISLELGGSNSVRNLWPQSYQTQPWNAYVKDELENELHRLVVSGQMDLPTAQHMIATNWIAAYQQVFHTQLPLKNHLRTASGHRRYKNEAPFQDADGDSP